jgi:hypothetical protein
MPGLGFAPSPRRNCKVNQGRESDCRKIAKDCRWRANADCNFPQLQTGMCDKPRVRPSRVSYREGNLMSGDLLTVSEGDSSEIRR